MLSYNKLPIRIKSNLNLIFELTKYNPVNLLPPILIVNMVQYKLKQGHQELIFIIQNLLKKGVIITHTFSPFNSHV